MDAAPHSDLSAPERSEAARGTTPEADAVARGIAESGLFDAAWYAARHPEAADDPLAHYLAHRNAAGIEPNPLFDTAWYRQQAPEAGADALLHFIARGAAAARDPHPLFDTAWYLACNGDVAGAGANPLQHYLAEGGREGRNVHPLFDTGWYLRQRPDVRAAGLNPLLHFLTDGGREGVDPHPLFDSAWYLARHPEVAATGQNPLVHYIRTGARLGYDPHPLFDTAWYRGRFPDAGENALLDYLGRDPEEGAEPHPLFDSPWYLAQAPDVAESGMNPAIHYLTDGARAGLGPHPLFDPAHYLQQVPEAPEARANPLLHYLTKDRGETDPHPLFDASFYLERNPTVRGANPLLHYRLHGAARDPHPLFDAAFYLSRNPDLVETGRSPLAHFIEGGAAEGRDPCRLFDTSWYLERNTDVAGSGQNPLVHFLGDGGREGRDPHPLFDSGWYRSCVPDLGAANPLVHYLAHGIRAGIDPNPLFDTAWYRARHPELGPDADPLADYIERGVHIGSEPHPLFDGGWYLRTYPDLIDAHETPLHHYLQFGVAEGRDPSPDFSTRWYLERHPDVARAGLNPLAHFAVAGRAEGRAPLPLEALHARRIAAERLALANEIQDIHRHIALMVVQPTFVVLLDDPDAEAAAQTRAALERQIYGRLRICDTRGAAAEALREADSYLLWLRAGDTLPPRALYDLACDINRAPGADLIYGDEEIAGPGGILPFFKPGWSPDYLESFDYIGRAACYRGAALADGITQAQGAYDLSLRLGAAGAPIRHLRRILLRNPDRRFGTDETERAQLGAHLERTGRAGARVEVAPGARRYAVAPGPRRETVSLITTLALGPAGEEARAVAAFLARIEAIRDGSSHALLEVIAVLDGVAAPAEAAALRAAGCRIVEVPERSAGPARRREAGARAASGAFLLFLDSDLEPVERHWIERMLIQFDKPAVGVVGARLLGTDGEFRHAGLVMHAGLPEAVREGNGGADGYVFSAAAARNFLAVSGACLMTRAALYHDAGGFDADLDGALWDTDYCLGRRAAGARIVYEPGAILADTRPWQPPRIGPGEAELFARRWGARIAQDPYYNADVLRLGPPNYDGRPVG